VVHALHEDVAFTRAVRDAVHHEIDQLADWLQVTVEDTVRSGVSPDELT
jgi:hypothetical protein